MDLELLKRIISNIEDCNLKDFVYIDQKHPNLKYTFTKIKQYEACLFPNKYNRYFETGVLTESRKEINESSIELPYGIRRPFKRITDYHSGRFRDVYFEPEIIVQKIITVPERIIKSTKVKKWILVEQEGEI